MKLLEAVESCRQGNFLTHRNFDSNESMHMHKGQLYYEDGANITNDFDFLRRQGWARENWEIKFMKEQVDEEKLNSLHEIKYFSRYGTTYEDAIIKYGRRIL